ncbi:glycoside hydrolase superfamily [Aspergillus similis]
MRLNLVPAIAAASVGLAAAGAIPRHSESEKTCANELWTGEVLHLSLNIIEYPIIVDVELQQNAVVTVDKTILIECTDAPTRLYTTVYATTTSTVTKTISTATITGATGLPAQTQTQSSTAPLNTTNKGGVQTEINTQPMISVNPSPTNGVNLGGWLEQEKVFNQYCGNQKEYLRKIAVYAIERYNMRIIVGLHSLPGGVNNLDIGEKIGNDGWFFNSTNLAYSYQAVEEILTFFEQTGYPWAFTISSLNEASDNPTQFASPNTLTANGTAWIVKYTKGVLARIAAVDKRIPLMLQDCFLSEEHWSPYFPAGTNLVIDQHVYYFAASGVYSQWANGAICGQASILPGDGKFPVFVGEWALQTLYSNDFEGRQKLFETQRYAWAKYVSGGAFWNIKHNSSAVVDGQGTQRDYWSFERLLDAGVIRAPVANATYC